MKQNRHIKINTIALSLIGALLALLPNSSRAVTYYWTTGDYTNGGSLSGDPGVYGYGIGPGLGSFNNDGVVNSTGWVGFELTSSATSIINTGTINSNVTSGLFYSGLYFSDSSASLTNLVNTGTISGTGSESYGIYNLGAIDTLQNSGTISGTRLAIVNSGNTINNLENTTSGAITGGIWSGSGGTIGKFTNNGSITSSTYAAIDNGGTINSIVNNGTVTSDNDHGISNSGTIGRIVNTGTIRGNLALASYGIANNDGTIQEITNTGTISGANNGIYNWTGVSSNIVTLNNSQGAGNPSGALTYNGKLPTNYNIIVNSPNSYGRLSGTSLTGSTTFGIYSGSTLTKGTYTSVLAGLTSGTNVSATSGMFNGTGWRLVETGAATGVWDLVADYSKTNTLASIQQSANALSGIYNVQAAALQAGLTYDCSTFDQYGLCASVGGRATYGLTAPSGNQEAGLVVVSHRPDSHFRYGGFADQSAATGSPNGIKYNNSGPMFGFFGYWNNQKDQMGLGASVTTAFSNSNLTVTRNASLANTEAGSGNTEMQGQAVQAQATYAIQATTKIKAQPYLGLRYYRVATGGYSEGSNADVTSPLTYNAMAQEVFAAVGGLGTSVFLAEKLTGNASVGIQQNLNYKMGNYQGTSSIMGLESFSVNMPSNVNSMATASAGLTYAVKKNEKLGVNVLWQQQAFDSTNTITALATYSFGF